MLVAETREIAEGAVKFVKASYENITAPVVEIGEAYKNAEKAGLLEKCFIGTFKSSKPAVAGGNTVRGEFRVGSQYHFVSNKHAHLVSKCTPFSKQLSIYSK